MPKSKENIELRSEEVEEILTKIPHWMIRWGNVLFLGLMMALLFISWFIKYPDIVVTEAIVATELPSYKEYSKTAGQIDAMLVENKQIVRSGQALAVIENTANYDDVFLISSILDTIHISSKSFEFPIDSIPILELGEIESAYAAFENNYLLYYINRDLRPFSNEAFANSYSLSELRIRLEAMKHQKELNQLELKYKKKDLERNELLFRQGVIAEKDLERAKLNFLQDERSSGSIKIAISQVQEAIKQAEKTTRTIEISRLENELILLRKVIQSFNQLKKQIKEWELNYVLKSEIDGAVIFLNHWHKNQIVLSGDLVFTVVPNENTTFIAKLRTPSQNFGKIAIGQKVSISLESYPETEFGVLEGEIVSISAIPNDDGLYLLEASLSHPLTTSYKKELDFKQEMKGVGKIITQDLRLIERFFYSLRKKVSI